MILRSLIRWKFDKSLELGMLLYASQLPYLENGKKKNQAKY